MKFKVSLAVLVAVCIMIGWVYRGIVDSPVPDKKMYQGVAWGYEQENNVWNRIRVDPNGNVICHKEE